MLINNKGVGMQGKYVHILHKRHGVDDDYSFVHIGAIYTRKDLLGQKMIVKANYFAEE